MAALERWVAEVSFEPMLPLLPTALGMEAPAGRASALRWLCTHTAQLDGAAEARRHLRDSSSLSLTETHRWAQPAQCLVCPSPWRPHRAAPPPPRHATPCR